MSGCARLDDLSMQEIFDKIAQHMLTQKSAGRDGLRMLHYGADGIRSPVGLFIPEDKYHHGLELWSLIDKRIQDAVGLDTDKPGGIRKLILISDLMKVYTLCKVKMWWFELDCIADKYQLKMNERL